ncbi:hypothetical protein M405DRAFT_12106 [Rhizopogon salebrosus TDB-379]|nr:hypothetical protein M405DRAFT_12106 [Rhizopogon salebrosus TDB-379]
MADFRDRVHAIWLCFEIPRAGGRFLETVTEDFLKPKREGAAGNKVPVVVVLTKYDEFIVHVERTLDGSLEGLSDDAVSKLVKQKTDAKLRDICTLPLERFAGSDIPYATVSTKEVHKEMVAPLIQITEERIRQHVIKEITFKRNTKACFHYKQYFSDLSSTFENDAFLHSGRFRILVIGKTGVGKSTLIDRAFGVRSALASDSMRGEATIDTEFISMQNDRLVLHDSKGFEPGEEDNVNIVRDFIERRRKKEALGDRLHAVW